jgi:hypothetical protein
MTDNEIATAVDAAYRKKYPDLVSVTVKHIVREILPGALVVVDCVETSGRRRSDEWEEICYVHNGVQIFNDTEELVRAMLNESRNIETIQDLQLRQKRRESGRRRLRWIQFGCLLVAVVFIAASVFMASGWRQNYAFLSLYGLAALVLFSSFRSRVHELDADMQEIDYKIDIQRFQVSVSETRAEKILRLNDFQLRRYYESTLKQNGWVFLLGILCIVLGVGISGFTLWLVVWSRADAKLSDKIVTAALGAVSSLLTNYVAVMYLKMHAAAAAAMITFHERLVATHQSLFGNLVASRITDDKLRWDTLAKIALNVSGATHLTKTKALAPEKSNGQRRASLARNKQTPGGGKLKARVGENE